jgi:predicted acylesterase/phospholipase RssA
MEEAGIEIEMAGGTSGGAIIAAMVAMGWDSEKIQKTLRLYMKESGSLLDYVLPVHSLTGGKIISGMLADVFGETLIEELPRPFFCVSCNLNRAEVVIHKTGLLRKAVASSIAIPGMMPPVAMDGELLIDGGALNNLPVDVMKRFSTGEIWAVDVSIKPEVKICQRYSGSLPSWKIWWSRINPFAEPIQVPTVVDILMSTAMLASQRQSELNRRLADVCLQPPVEEFKLLDFKSFDRIVDAGYRHARQAIACLDAPDLPQHSFSSCEPIAE